MMISSKIWHKNACATCVSVFHVIALKINSEIQDCKETARTLGEQNPNNFDSCQLNG